MNKLIKSCAIGGIIWGATELSFLYGKGYVLGVLKAYEKSATDAITICSGDSSKKLRFMAKIANSTTDWIKKEVK